jgi:hypothetical protein
LKLEKLKREKKKETPTEVTSDTEK